MDNQTICLITTTLCALAQSILYLLVMSKTSSAKKNPRDYSARTHGVQPFSLAASY